MSILSLPRDQRVEAVKGHIVTAFHDWQPPYPEGECVGKPAFRSAESDFAFLKGVADWRGALAADLRKVYPQWIAMEYWMYFLPAFLLCFETSDSIGFSPTALGLPPAPSGNAEVMSLEELTLRFNLLQLGAVASFVELHHWLRQVESYSHWDAGWHVVAATAPTRLPNERKSSS